MVNGHTILEEYYCKDATIEYGKSLKAGNAAGLFDNYGTVKNIQVSRFFKCTITHKISRDFEPSF